VTIFEYWPALVSGVWFTLQITNTAALLAIVVSFVTGIARLSRHRWIRWPLAVYVEFFRGTSCYIQLFWLFYALPFFGITMNAFAVGVVAIGLNIGSFGSEVVRAAILSVPMAQREAAIALNYSRWQQLVRVILPQALPATLPPMSNLIIELLKSTPLVSLITIADLTFRAQLFRKQTAETFQAFGVILVLYFIVASIIDWGFRALERKVSRGLPTTARNL
jgi:polar amino acid transport system permease protein